MVWEKFLFKKNQKNYGLVFYYQSGNSVVIL